MDENGDKIGDDLGAENAYIDNETGMLIIKADAAKEGRYKVELMNHHGNFERLEYYYITFLPIEDAGMLLEEDLKGKYEHQSPAYLEDKTLFVRQGSIDFDYYPLTWKRNVDMPYDYRGVIITEKKDIQCSPVPLEWDESTYAYFPDGDYQIYTITNSTNYVGWRDPSVRQLHPVEDRKSVETGGKEKGNFIYVNASGQLGKLLSLNWSYNGICNQNRIYVSGWVNELIYNKETANLAIKIVGIKDSGEEKVLNTYITGYIPCGKENEGKTNHHPLYQEKEEDYHDSEVDQDKKVGIYVGKWFHIYYSFVPELTEAEKNEDFDNYKLVIENNAAGSDGADFLLDDFRLYTDKNVIRAEQIKTDCNNTTTIRVSRDIANIRANELQSLCYAIYDVNEKIIENGRGEFTYDRDYLKNTVWRENLMDNQAGRFTQGAANYICFNKTLHFLDREGNKPANDNSDQNAVFVKPGARYFIAFGTYDELNPDKRDESPCAKYCEFTVKRNIRPEVDGVEDDGQLSYCYGSNELVTVNMYDNHGDKVDGVTYDWYHGSMKDFNSITGLQDAIEHFREEYPEQVGLDENVTVKGELTDNDIAILQKGIDERKLILANSESNLIQMTDRNTSFVVIPTGNITTLQTYCPNPAEIILRADGGSPCLNVGFIDINLTTRKALTR